VSTERLVAAVARDRLLFSDPLRDPDRLPDPERSLLDPDPLLLLLPERLLWREPLSVLDLYNVRLLSNPRKRLCACTAGLPDGLFSYLPKIPLWVNFGGPYKGKRWYIFYNHLESYTAIGYTYFMAVWYCLLSFGMFWYVWAKKNLA
jgi:hypothetical protein